jgi:hypothetical protein
MSPFASFDGKNPGDRLFAVIFLGPSSTARFRARCVAAAFEAEYMIVPLSPVCGTTEPAMELTITTREGEVGVPDVWRRGVNLEYQPTSTHLYQIG